MSDKKVFVVDVARCSGCFNCQLACKDEHCGNDWSPYAKPQPDTGQFWLRLEQNERGTIPKVKVHYIPRLCRHCDDAACMTAAPEAVYRREDGLVIIDPEKAAGNEKLVQSCPFGAIYWNEDLKLAQKCTGCAHLLDVGQAPRCVDACPTDALGFGTEDEFKDLAAQAKPETGDRGSHVYYLNVPERFIAGTVYDPIDREVVIGAVCRLKSGGGEWTVNSDEYGDFWFVDLEEQHEYELTIESPEFDTKSFLKLSAKDDLNLGDIPLARKSTIGL